jgi:hypothetical protein
MFLYKTFTIAKVKISWPSGNETVDKIHKNVETKEAKVQFKLDIGGKTVCNSKYDHS